MLLQTKKHSHGSSTKLTIIHNNESAFSTHFLSAINSTTALLNRDGKGKMSN
tara:strand:- start:173851 stop:174006 length:156 start_codon:yes stop_codon:yes gene_type:complete